MITQFRVQNYKALRDVTLDLTPIHVLIGPNDSGKTSLLEALATLCRSMDMPAKDAFVARSPVASLKSHNSRQLPNERIAFAVKLPDQGYKAQYVPPALQNDLDYFDMSIFDPVACYKSSFNREDDHLEDWPAGSMVLIRNQLNPLHFYRWNPEALKLPVVLDARRNLCMERSGFGLAQVLDELRNDREKFAAIEKRFCEFFPHVASIELTVEAAYVVPSGDVKQVQRSEVASGKGIQFRLTNNSRLPAAEASDGMMLVLAYLTLFHLPEPPRVLLLEEPENGIHPARLREVVTILKQLVAEQDQTQVVLTTHSPDLVSQFRPEEVTLFRKQDNGEVTTRRLSESRPVQEQVDFFTLGEIWTLDGDEALMEPVSSQEVAG